LSTGAPSPEQLERLIAWQLGREPAIAYVVAVDCEYGWPMVLRNEPRDSAGEPNPNLYYLCCPWMRRELARLEDAGLIDALQKQLTVDREFAAGTIAAQENHTRETGFLIAAAREPLLLKCLHAHMAYHIVHSDYRLGELIARRLGRLKCPDERCGRWLDEQQADELSARTGDPH